MFVCMSASTLPTVIVAAATIHMTHCIVSVGSQFVRLINFTRPMNPPNLGRNANTPVSGAAAP